jgi:hypothetical protein
MTALYHLIKKNTIDFIIFMKFYIFPFFYAFATYIKESTLTGYERCDIIYLKL